MKIDYVFAAVASGDLELAEKFYTAVLGRGADDRPMPSLIQWRNVANAGVQVFLDEANAGHGSMTLVVADVDRVRSGLEQAGYRSDVVTAGDFGRILRVMYPDGNAVIFAEPPATP